MTAGIMGAGSTSALILAGTWFRFDLLWVTLITLPAVVVCLDSGARIGVLSAAGVVPNAMGSSSITTIPSGSVGIEVPIIFGSSAPRIISTWRSRTTVRNGWTNTAVQMTVPANRTRLSNFARTKFPAFSNDPPGRGVLALRTKS